jgi:hypothetical protein
LASSSDHFGAGKPARGVKSEGSAPSGPFAFEQEGRKGEEGRKGHDGMEAVMRGIEALAKRKSPQIA